MIHATADVDPSAQVGSDTRIWNRVQVRENASVGANCVIGKDAYIDFGVAIGDNVKIQNAALIYHGATVEDGVFIGPQVCLTNDKLPRAINPDGSVKDQSHWEGGHILVRCGASVGAGATVLPGVTIGRFALVGAGALVAHDVPDHGLVVGVPARLIGYVCKCAQRLARTEDRRWTCEQCEAIYEFDTAIG